MSLDLADDKLTLVQVMYGNTWANVDPDVCRQMVLQSHNEVILPLHTYVNNPWIYLRNHKSLLQRKISHHVLTQNNLMTSKG